MNTRGAITCSSLLLLCCLLMCPRSHAQASASSVLPRQKLAEQAFGNDAPWYIANIPFLEIDDPALQRTYYYRWQVYRSHIRDLGTHGTDVTEFLPPVPWSRHPYEDLNDSSSFHILEGRWLRDPRYVEGLIQHLYIDGGNDRHFSESLASATLAFTQVTGDPAPALQVLDNMRATYNAWNDHFDAERGLYWIEPLLDATEYTVGSIDASGAGFTSKPNPSNDGFFGGFAFRPSINAYQYANARAIAAIALLAGQNTVAADFNRRAVNLQVAALAQLWNPGLHYLTDVYQRSTPTAKQGDFIRNRELVGLVPWQFHLVPDTAASQYSPGWRNALDPAELGGPHGLRTAGPSYPRYLVQYRFDKATGLPECQWNGPSWPFQTSQVLSGMANLLADYPAQAAAAADVTTADYLHLLRQYTREHQLPSGSLDLQEDYNPDTGAVIVGLPRSHHYLHSTYNDLLLSGLLGIRPRQDDVLELHPLLPASSPHEPAIRYFALEGLRYHGHEIAIRYDADGTRYHRGKGLTVVSDGRVLAVQPTLAPLTVTLPHSPSSAPPMQALPINLASNVWGRAPSAFEPDLPIATASSQAPEPDTISAPAPMLYQPLDGRDWFFPEIAHGWSPAAAAPASGEPDWYEVDLRHVSPMERVELSFFDDGNTVAVPASVAIMVRNPDGQWKPVTPLQPGPPIANGITNIRFNAVQAQHIRILLGRSKGLPGRLIAFRVFGPASHER